MMVSSNGWFELPDSPEQGLEQGDIIFGIPVAYFASESETLSLDIIKQDKRVAVVEHDGIILSQSCDIGGGKSVKQDKVLLAPVFTLEDFKNENPGLVSNVALEGMRLGRMPSHHMLNDCDIPNFVRGKSVVLFRQPFAVPLDFLNKMVKHDGGLRRIKMRSPYREYMSAAYGRSITRVGLPSDIEKFPVEDKNIDKFLRDLTLKTKEERAKIMQEIESISQNGDW